MKGKSTQQKPSSFVATVGAGLAAFGLIFFLTSCSPNGNSASETTATAPSSNAATASDASQGASNPPEVNEIDKSAFVGTWQLAETEMADGTVVSHDDLEEFRAQGLDSFLILNEDGSAVQVVLGANYYGNWKANTTDVGIANIDGLLLTLELGSNTMIASAEGLLSSVYKKSDDVAVMAEEEYKAAVEAFAGMWYITSATRNGMTITVEDGQISSDTATLELTPDMHAAFTVEGEAAPETRWGITDSSTGYVHNPITGELLTLSDGYLTLDMGEEAGTMTFVKE